VRLGLAKAKKNLPKLNPKDWGALQIARFDLRVLEQMEALCKDDGVLLRCILDTKASGTDLEHRLREVSKRLVSKTLFGGMGPCLGQIFSAAQRKYLSYLVWRLVLADDRRTRRKKAKSRAITRY
jgi:hypothetical protein